MTDIGSDDRETSKVIGIHDGARSIGWIEAMETVAGLVSEMCRERRIAGKTGGTYSEGLNDLLNRMQVLMAERRKK